jgi:membrane protease YdiL (CAAX protease family)
MLISKWVIISFVPAFKDLPMTHFGHVKQSWFHLFSHKAPVHGVFVLIAIYMLLIPFQEFIARGCLQSCFQNFFRGPHHTINAILASNLLFALFHALHPFSFILVAFLLGIFWGWLFERHKSLIGVSVSHILVAAWGFYILDYSKVLVF